MLQINAFGMYCSTLFPMKNGLFHGYTTKKFGDMRKNQAGRKNILNRLFVSGGKLYRGEQVHGNSISVVSAEERELTQYGSDALLLLYPNQKSGPVCLGVFVADCVPLLFYDPGTHMIGTAHAGWRGTLGDITGNMIRLMKHHGAEAKNIRVSVGPHICAGCYDISKERASEFIALFGASDDIVQNRKDRWFLDLGKANVQRLVSQGVLTEHIDESTFCTSCDNEEFFSFRKDTKETFGEIMGVIGWE